MFVSLWIIVFVGLVLAYLLVMNAHLHRRVRKLEAIVRRLEGVSEEEVKKQIKERMTQYDAGGD